MMASGDNPKWGFIDKTGTIVIPLQYAYANRFSEGLCMVVEFDEAGSQRCGYIDKAGTVVIPPQFVAASDFSGGVAAVGNMSSPSYIDKTGKVIWQGE
jgi:hypothetical protein